MRLRSYNGHPRMWINKDVDKWSRNKPNTTPREYYRVKIKRKWQTVLVWAAFDTITGMYIVESDIPTSVIDIGATLTLISNSDEDQYAFVYCCPFICLWTEGLQNLQNPNSWVDILWPEVLPRVHHNKYRTINIGGRLIRNNITLNKDSRKLI